MKWTARQESKWRRFGIAAFLTVAVFLVMLTGCVKQFIHDPLYDQDLLVPSPADSSTYIRITIQNNRVLDALPPHFYLIGTGTHSLGVVEGMGTTLTRFIDTSWFGPDDCMVIEAHYVGTGSWVSPKFCFRAGDWIDVKLQNIMSTSSAWSHP